MHVWLWLGACGGPPGPDCDVAGPHLLVASTDYQSGILGAVAVDGSCVAEPLASSGPDPVVRAVGDRVVYADRTRGDAVRLYVPGEYSSPEVEFALPAGGNTHDVLRRGDTLWFARWDEAALRVTDLRGRVVREVDLSPWADADGIPEADRFVDAGDRVFLALQRLDRAAGLQEPGGPGLVLELDPDTAEVVEATEVGPNPRLWAGAGGWVATTGLFFALDGEVVRGGAGAPEVVAREADLGFDVTIAADTPSGLVLLGLDEVDTEPSHLVCGDRHERFDGFPVEVAVDTDGTVWGATRETDWTEPPAGERRAVRVDADGCALEPVGDALMLGPQSLAWVDAG